ncbi:hypothetical protein HN587_04060 [Candidatus Woesearchaeota archaeon]|jgi:hypothetical protein|nr:hypothetical protein [Candidatus Woesearchaeota archaeon]
MEEVSNKTLAILLVAAIVVSLGGVVLSMNKLGKVTVVTGFASGTNTTQDGEVTLNITAYSSFEFIDSAIAFGSATLNGSDDSTYYECWSGNGTETNDALFPDLVCPTDAVQIHNDGSFDLSINFTSSLVSTSFICDQCNDVAPSFKYASNLAGGSYVNECADGDIPTYAEITGSSQVVCTDLDVAEDTSVSSYVKIPKGANKGGQTATWTFVAECSETPCDADPD